jgi:uncharacterized protein YqeY
VLKDKIKQAAAAALKKGDKRRVEALKYLVAQLEKKEMSLPVGKMSEADESGVLRKELKNKEEARELFGRAQRQELVDQVDFEIEVLKEYLPKEMDESELVVMVEAAIEEKGHNFGAVMAEVMRKVAGRASGEAVAKIVREKLP